ncbi:hypothetical protein E2K93_12635 [Thalassotalea sp. HSM 43]|uniref:hypothetical protein n=1 Tax=Thalassotalea sp. HSM 43 TaxID=2552945 RepID=UPI001081E6D8|nr:hypothetical protein [Thalassotalea sp. HSM 43]QBY05177.1 hypothetical protein E2K93_12635 [Thalassotalea sp. HSM 43]
MNKIDFTLAFLLLVGTLNLIGCDSVDTNDKSTKAKLEQTASENERSLSNVDKLFDSNNSCAGENKVLPIRLTIDLHNTMYAYNSIITEDYLVSILKSLPKGCDNARITFLYESDDSLEYIAKVNSILEESGTFKNYTPILLKFPSPRVY